VDGYRRASEKAIKILREISTEIDPKDKEDLARIARTTMASKMISGQSEILANIVVDAILRIVEEYESEENIGRRTEGNRKSKYKVDLDNIKVEKKAGASVSDTRLI
jgi:chaperonin GroEL (HSP60 family)